MTMKRKFNLVVRSFAFAVIVWMLPLEAILSICYVYVSRDYMTAKDAPSLIKRLGMIILRSFVGYLVLAIVLIWAMEIQGVTMHNLLYAFIAWELTLFMPEGYPCRAPNILLCSLNNYAQSLSNSMS